MHIALPALLLALILGLLLVSCPQPTGAVGGPDSGDTPDPFAFDPLTASLSFAASYGAGDGLLPDTSIALTSCAAGVYAAGSRTDPEVASVVAHADAGSPWSAVSAAPGDLFYVDISEHDGVLYASGVYNQILNTIAYGSSQSQEWIDFDLPAALKTTVRVTAIHSDTLYIGTTTGLFELPLASPEDSADEMEAPVAASDNEVVDLYAGTDSLYGVVLVPRKTLAMDRYIYVDPDSGAWTSVVISEKEIGSYGRLTAIAVDESNLFLGSEDGVIAGVAGSTQAADYSRHPLCPATDPGSATEVHDITISDGVVYAATSAGLWYSLDYGIEWFHLDDDDGLPDEVWHAVATVKNRVYLASNGFGIAELIWQ
jgi:hypothetical protein